MTINAGFLSREQEPLVGIDRARALPRDVHRFGTVTVAAFEGVVGLHPRPFVRGQFGPMVEELFPRVDGAENLSPHLFGSLRLAAPVICRTIENQWNQAKG